MSIPEANVVKATSEVVPVADATPIFPPRPDAIVTMLTSDDFLPGAQTLLYSLKKSLPKPKATSYPPELLVLVTPNVSESTREALCPVYCSRIIQVDPLDFPANSLDHKQVTSTHVPSWSSQGALTKLHIFRLDVYDVILYIDADCLVVKDISHLLELGKIYQESEALVAAVPDIMPPDKFNAGVMVVRPNKAVFDNMMNQRSLLTTYDGGDTGFLNAYFSNWYTDMPPFARLKFGYNAQRFLYHCTYEKQPSYWDLSVAPDLHIIHFSSSPKPWDSKPVAEDPTQSCTAQSHLSEGDVKKLKRVSASSELESLWWQWYIKSKNYVQSYHKEAEKKEAEHKKVVQTARKRAIEDSRPKTPKELHKLVSMRYKELRREGKDSKEAMMLARREFGQDGEEPSASKQVAKMFGIM